MFSHLLHYSCKQLIRAKEVIFWTLLFPVLLATFMYMAFGKISDATEKMSTIQVALYEGKEEVALETTLQQLSQIKEGDKAFINVKKADSMEQAEQWLKEEKVHGVLCQEEKLTLKVAQNGIEQSVLQQIVNQYIHYKDTLERLARENPQKLADAMEQMKSETIGFTEKKTTEGNMDDTVSYFYAIFAMTCLFASFAGADKAVRLQADTSVLGMRRGVAPVSKARAILADFISCEVLEYASALLVYGYMRFVLGIELGEKNRNDPAPSAGGNLLRNHVWFLYRSPSKTFGRCESRNLCRGQSHVLRHERPDGKRHPGLFCPSCAICEPHQSGGVDRRFFLCFECVQYIWKSLPESGTAYVPDFGVWSLEFVTGQEEEICKCIKHFF